MVIKIKAYQKRGIKTEKCIDEFEFCCWKDLKKWLNSYSILHECPNCVNKKKAMEEE